MHWYLDCYHSGALLGDEFPVATYGPADREDVEMLRGRLGPHFHRTEVVEHTRGRNPLPRHRWPGVPRPR